MIKIIILFIVNLSIISCSKMVFESDKNTPGLIFNATQDSVIVGESCHLEWLSTNSTGVNINHEIGIQNPTGEIEFKINNSGIIIFTCTAFNSDELITKSDTVVAYFNLIRPIFPSLSAEIIEDSVVVGDSYTLKWYSDGINVFIKSIGQQQPNGSLKLNAYNIATLKFDFIATSSTGHVTTSSDSIIIIPRKFIIPNLNVKINKDSINLGETFILEWYSDASKIVIDNGIGERNAPNGQEILSINDINRVGWNTYNITGFSETGHSNNQSDSVYVKPTPNDQVFEFINNISIKEDESILNALTFNISQKGKYKVLFEVWYNSGDSQKNESFYINVSDQFPIDPNAGIYKVIQDMPGKYVGMSRDCGTFLFDVGQYNLNIYHYSLISQIYPQYLNGKIDVDSVKITAITIVYINE